VFFLDLETIAASRVKGVSWQLEEKSYHDITGCISSALYSYFEVAGKVLCRYTGLEIELKGGELKSATLASVTQRDRHTYQDQLGKHVSYTAYTRPSSRIWIFIDLYCSLLREQRLEVYFISWKQSRESCVANDSELDLPGE
jgi:hypothetical protein